MAFVLIHEHNTHNRSNGVSQPEHWKLMKFVCDDFYLMKVNRNLWRRTKSFDGRGEKSWIELSLGAGNSRARVALFQDSFGIGKASFVKGFQPDILLIFIGNLNARSRKW